MTRSSAALLLAAVILSACDDPGSPAIPSEVEAIVTTDQVATVGTAVPNAPAVRVLDERGGVIAGASVRFSVTEGEGHVVNSSARTNRDGIASAGGWTLGGKAGTNKVVAETPGLGPVEFVATGTAGAAARLSIESGDGQAGVAGTKLAQQVTVRVTDAFGNGAPRVGVNFESFPGDGSVESSSSMTDDTGVASAIWTLGPAVREQRLRATVADVGETVFRAISEAGPPATLVILEGDGQSARVQTAVAILPAVRALDAFGNLACHATVRFEVVSGDGVLTSSGDASILVTTDSTGLARLPFWTLGTRAGINVVQATAGSATATFTATGLPGPPVALNKIQGDGVNGLPGLQLSVLPAVQAVDSHQNGVPGVTVTFAVIEGGGSITGTTGATDATGIVEVGSWTLGPSTGTNVLHAESPGLGAVSFTAIATNAVGGGSGGGGSNSDPYQMVIRSFGSSAGSYHAALESGAGRWASIVVGGLPSMQVSLQAGTCGINHPAIDEVIDDILILVEITSIDGPGNVLGSAGPCVLRAVSGLPAVGVIQLDVADVSQLVSTGRFESVVAHEVGHILGIGTRWSDNVMGAGGPDPYHVGGASRAGFKAIGGAAYGGLPVPVENMGGPGTRDSHWRESVLGGELMTGWLDWAGGALSELTVGALADLGYVVDASGADPFSLAGSQPNQISADQPPPLRIVEVPLRIRPITAR